MFVSLPSKVARVKQGRVIAIEKMNELILTD